MKEINHKIAEDLIDQFDITPNHYRRLSSNLRSIEDANNNHIYLQNIDVSTIQNIISIAYSRDVTNTSIFIKDGLKGSIRIHVNASNSLIYIGEECNLKNLNIYTQSDKSYVLIGNSVTTNGSNSWMTGLNSGDSPHGIVIGDDCMFSYGNEIRGSDAHPIIDTTTLSQTNAPRADVVIEPHVWIGMHASILKATTIGACSIIPAGIFCRTSIPRGSIATSTPPFYKKSNQRVWSRGMQKHSIEKAINFYRKFIENHGAHSQ